MERPNRAALETYQTCLAGVESEELKGRLERIQLTVVRESENYDTAAAQGQFHTVARAERIDGLVSAEEMSELYSTYLAQQGAAGRAIYNELIGAAPNGRCPLCGHGVVSTLDHFLPKYRYPALSVTPLNLVPACVDCNKRKSTGFPKSAQEATLHPYFDDVEKDSWLVAEVLEQRPTVIRFRVKPVDGWDEVKQARVEKHFKQFKLAKLYTSNAADELLNIRGSLRRTFQGGMATVQAHLQEEACSRAEARVNSWQAAMYGALAACEWYCGGGFE